MQKQEKDRHRLEEHESLAGGGFFQPVFITENIPCLFCAGVSNSQLSCAAAACTGRQYVSDAENG